MAREKKRDAQKEKERRGRGTAGKKRTD